MTVTYPRFSWLALSNTSPINSMCVSLINIFHLQEMVWNRPLLTDLDDCGAFLKQIWSSSWRNSLLKMTYVNGALQKLPAIPMYSGIDHGDSSNAISFCGSNALVTYRHIQGTNDVM